MNIIAFDVSTKTGVIVLSDDPAFYFSTELENKKLKGLDRVVWFKEAAGKLLDTYKPTLAVIEGYGYGNAFTLVTLVEIGTAVRLACKERNIDMVFIPPTSLKSFIGDGEGKGKISKDMIMLEVFKRWGFDPSTNNIADAYGLARIGKAIHGLDKITKAAATKLGKIESVGEYMKKNSLIF